MNNSKKIRKLILDAAYKSKASHIGSALSVVEILNAIYFRVANISSSNCKSKDRDIIVLSKGHASLALYCTLALKEIIPIKTLEEYVVNGGVLPCHIDMNSADGLEASTGSLGHGLGLAHGFALANRIQKIKSRIFVIIGDGEFQEGSILEAINLIGSQRLNEITIILDDNGFQSSAATSAVIGISNYKKIFEAFGFCAYETDGHDIDELENVLNKTCDRPVAVIAKTKKGRGFSFMEDTIESHYMKIDDSRYEIGLKELE